MEARNISPKDDIEGPPPRKCPILLRQTSFKALSEKVHFKNSDGEGKRGNHKARFGEIEQRGAAVTQKGIDLRDTRSAQVPKSRQDEIQLFPLLVEFHPPLFAKFY